MYVLSHIFLNPIFNVFHNSSTFQAVIGRPDKQEVHTDNHIKVGTMVAVYLAKYAGEWPQIGKVTDTNTDEGTYTIQWYGSSISGAWTPCTIYAKGGNRKRIARLEEIQCNNIWLHGFKLTPCGKLNQKTLDQIKEFNDF